MIFNLVSLEDGIHWLTRCLVPTPTQQLVWLRLNREANKTVSDEISLLSLNQKLITPDKRFKVRRQSPLKWSLTLEQVVPDDGHAYYLCQAGGERHSAGECVAAVSPACNSRATKMTNRFVGGARLNVLAPPKIIELDTSPSLVHANEFEPLKLRCKVIGEPQSQLMWKREDGQPLQAGAEQRFMHQIERRPSQIVSLDSSELSFEPHFTRDQAGVYHCIASNGIQPGVSRRINVVAAKCRALAADPSSASEPCDQPTAQAAASTEPPASASKLRVWRTGQQPNQQQQQTNKPSKPSRPATDKRRTLATASQRNDGELSLIDIRFAVTTTQTNQHKSHENYIPQQ